ncbi:MULTISPECIES: hypothetical protein [Streptomyces]|uniref:hypothetical protein n=1 Tax=Streptomyces TaxID=1883 RepID=UPI00167A958D|nr:MULTISPECIES: hypothetical protein [Streptomyces]MBD3579337.1 hypothetical protein [Streptomyces sp. KD18]GGS93742.1 hypothetical protein GCM10010286_18140 [Streptomyces toxytricini]
MSTARPQADREATGPFAAADAFFRACTGSHAPDADERPVDPLIGRMQIGRTLLGLGGAVWLVLAYPLSSGREEFVLGKIAELGMACAVLLAGSVLGIAAFLAAGTPERRRAFARRLSGPLVCVLALALGPALFWLSLSTVKGDLVGEVELVDFYSSLLGRGILCSVLSFLTLVVGCLLAVAVLIVSVPYTIVTAYVCVSSCFRASDVHQLLPALLSPLLVWSLFAFQLFNGPDVAAPPEVLYTFLLGGPLSVTALSIWEVRRLRTHYGITLRSALGR